MPSEASIVRSILTYLKSLPCCHAIKLHGNQYQTGQPDIMCMHRGTLFLFEVKRPGKKATKLQQHTLDVWANVGAVCGVVTSLKEVKDMIKEG